MVQNHVQCEKTNEKSRASSFKHFEVIYKSIETDQISSADTNPTILSSSMSSTTLTTTSSTVSNDGNVIDEADLLFTACSIHILTSSTELDARTGSHCSAGMDAGSASSQRGVSTLMFTSRGVLLEVVEVLVTSERTRRGGMISVGESLTHDFAGGCWIAVRRMSRRRTEEGI
jgi:hypothetical protein